MKPSHLILSLAGALGVLGASAACASDVEVYGALDTALTWQNRDYVDQAAASTLQMKSGQWIGSRVGIKGSERLDNGVTVGFVLENGFATDAGTLGQGGRFSLSRRTTVYTGGDWIRSDYSTEHEADHPGAIENIYEFTVGLVHRF